MALVLIDQITRGMRPSERTIAIKDAFGKRVYLRVEEDFMVQRDGKFWLTVGVINEDKVHPVVLVEMPQEPDSGPYRIWAKKTDLLEWDRSHT